MHDDGPCICFGQLKLKNDSNMKIELLPCQHFSKSSGGWIWATDLGLPRCSLPHSSKFLILVSSLNFHVLHSKPL